MSRFLIITLMLSACTSLFGQTTNRLAPGAPGDDAHWPSAAKNGFGTSNTEASKVWFTLTNGVMTEAFYPRLDVPNSQTLQLIVCNRQGCQTEADDMDHELRILDPRSLSFQQVNRARDNSYRITKTYATDPERATILVHVEIAAPNDRDVYVHYDPSLNNSGMHDTGWTDGNALLSVDGNVASALVASGGFSEMSNGFRGRSDGVTQLKRTGVITAKYERAENGNVVQVARLGPQRRLTLALGFGTNAEQALTNAKASLAKGFRRVRRDYDAGWHLYLGALLRVEPAYQRQFNMSAMVLKALEDKTYRGAMAASPSVPWGGGPNANEPTVSGYHAVWSRDLYQVSTAFLAMGDRATANRALEYLFSVQQKRDGSFPQNSWIDGRPIGGGLQMDQVSFPLVLAYQLGRTDRLTWLKHIKPAADFIVRKGPSTEQERWEEESGYSPSTIAAEIAGLVCAAHIARLNGKTTSASLYLNKADEWALEVERWTATTNGPHAKGKYYLRLTQGDPNAPAKLEINSNGGVYDQREIVDAGFLELVRLGIKRADDPAIVDSLKILDKLIKVNTVNGSGWYRYNQDAYGERPNGGDYDARSGKGRLWTLLTGERGEYELARGNLTDARNSLNSMMAFANDGLMIPEQVWDVQNSPRPGLRFGEGTGSATPLAWSMAQFIRLALSVRANRNLGTPAVVRTRFQKGPTGN